MSQVTHLTIGYLSNLLYCILFSRLSILVGLTNASGCLSQNITSNVTNEDDSNWLHRIDAYHMQEIAGRMKAVAVPHGHANVQTIQHNARPLTQLSGVETPYYSQTVNLQTPG
jgi:hypothetical protein